MITTYLDHQNRLTITVEIGPNASLEELYSEVEQFFQERHADLRTQPTNDQILDFLLAERSYLEPPK